MQKTFFWSLKNCFFAKPSFSEFHESNVEKNIFLEPEKLFFLQSHACMNFKRLVCKKHFFGAWKIVFSQSPASLSFMRAMWKKNIFLEPEKLFFLQSHACMNFKRLVCKKTFFWSLKNCFSATATHAKPRCACPLSRESLVGFRSAEAFLRGGVCTLQDESLRRPSGPSPFGQSVEPERSWSTEVFAEASNRGLLWAR